MTRSEFVRRIVLNEICDHPQNVDQCILLHAAIEGAKCGLTIERSEIVNALAGLIKDELAKASGEEYQVMPPMDLIEDDEENFFKTYFEITTTGMVLHLFDDPSDPIDAEGNLRPDWHLDAE